MENVMKELIEIENSANEYIKRAEDEKRKLPARISLSTLEIENKLEGEARKELGDIAARTEAETLAIVEKTRLDGAEKIRAMETEYAERKSEWIETIFANVLHSGGEKDGIRRA